MTFRDYQSRCKALRERVSAIDDLMFARANDLALRARVGLGRNVWSNAMNAYHAGRPWPEVNYPLLRKAIWIENRRSVPHEIANRYERKLWSQVEMPR